MILARTVMLFIALSSVLFVAVTASRSKRPMLRGVASAMCGIAALGTVNLLAPFTDVGLLLNYASAFIAVVLSVPGVVMMLILRVLLLF
ncbi:MAG: pro-sigmaK processing inhibitor BofA family protein [Oscillospiraceae bacterium]